MRLPELILGWRRRRYACGCVCICAATPFLLHGPWRFVSAAAASLPAFLCFRFSVPLSPWCFASLSLSLIPAACALRSWDPALLCLDLVTQTREEQICHQGESTSLQLLLWSWRPSLSLSVSSFLLFVLMLI